MFRWSAGAHRIAGEFVYLNDLRLNALLCIKGRVMFCCAAPVLYVGRGRATVRFYDKNVLKVQNGKRQSVNILASWLKDDEEATEVKYLAHEIVKENAKQWIAQKIMSMACAQPLHSAYHVPVPQMYRLTRNPETLVPVITTAMYKALGLSRDTPMADVRAAFLSKLNLFGDTIDDGYVIADEYVVSGGCCVASARGMFPKSGSVVFTMPATTFLAEMDEKNWCVGGDQ